MRLAREERADLAEVLSQLTEQQWNAPTLCTRWRVRDVVAHIISYDHLARRTPCRGSALRPHRSADHSVLSGPGTAAGRHRHRLARRTRSHRAGSGRGHPDGHRRTRGRTDRSRRHRPAHTHPPHS
ncbi:maleylpyruvate isomerase family mycothiol-dependent enzyme [Amycolatopsis antarctica]|nr:maleylpyruvate isomerase family mycothiol-dependent enzyme [Amycolatopsis antarctica]